MSNAIRVGTIAIFSRCTSSFSTLAVSKMKDFSDASFSPEAIQSMSKALQDSVDTLPEPVSSHVIHRLAETILRVTRDGERDPKVLQRLALLELQIGPES